MKLPLIEGQAPLSGCLEGRSHKKIEGTELNRYMILDYSTYPLLGYPNNPWKTVVFRLGWAHTPLSLSL